MTTSVKERPILFSGPMVKSILDGRKTQTRRIVDIKKMTGPCETHESRGKVRRVDGLFQWSAGEWNVWSTPKPCPYGAKGDHLWVRETWRSWRWNDRVKPIEFSQRWGDENPRDYIGWDADNDLTRPSQQGPITMDGKTRVSIHMPRWASRITLEITGVRVERLQEISREDCLAEGIQKFTDGQGINDYTSDGEKHFAGNPKDSYRLLWEQINGAGSWEANPYVWIIEFKRVN